jgi:hypothetical protein
MDPLNGGACNLGCTRAPARGLVISPLNQSLVSCTLSIYHYASCRHTLTACSRFIMLSASRAPATQTVMLSQCSAVSSPLSLSAATTCLTHCTCKQMTRLGFHWVWLPGFHLRKSLPAVHLESTSGINRATEQEWAACAGTMGHATFGLLGCFIFGDFLLWASCAEDFMG